jgi:basic membrane protein A and related proteins
MLALSLALATCATPSVTPVPGTPLPANLPTVPAAAPTIAATVAQPTTSAVASTMAALPTSTPVPLTPTPHPLIIGYAGAPPPAAAKLEAAVAAIQQAAKDFGWEITLGMANGSIEGTVSDLVAQQGAQVVVTLGQPMQAATLTAARKYPDVYFIGLYQTGTDLPANVLLLDDTAPREDQAGFLAGMAAGLATHVQRVAVIGDPTSPAGLRYRNGFLHGVRYTCPRCRLDNIDLLNADDTAGAVETAGRYRLYGVDVFFAAAGDAGDAALVKVTQAGAWGIGSGRDVVATVFNGGATAGADKILTSVYIDPAAAVSNALTLYHAGTPLTGTQSLSAATGALILAPVRLAAGGLSPLDQHDLATMLSHLADGTFDTGIDPVTGAER